MGFPTAPGPSATASDSRPAGLSRRSLSETGRPASAASGHSGAASRTQTARRAWTINGRFLTQPVTGVQRYAREVVSALDQLISEGHPLAEGVRMELAFPGLGDVPDLQAIALRRLPAASGHLWEQAVLPLAVAGGLLNLCNTAPLVLRKQIVCMHDVTFRLYPDSYTPTFRRVYSVLIPALGRRAAAVATVSAFSAQQLSGLGGVPPEKITLHPNGHEHAARWLPMHDDVTRTAASLDTIVILGSRAPHKNVDLILDMADELGRAGLKIALVGSLDERVFRRGAGGLAPNVRALGRLSDEALAALLGDSLCLAFPSLTEGFGLPPLEAMAIGCPVVVSDRGSLPEICGDAALYVSPSDPREWLSAFIRLRNDPRLRSDLILRGQERAAGFSWRETAIRYLMLMARLDGVDS